MNKFVSGATMSRTDLLRSKADGLQKLVAKFLAHRHSRFDTPYGVEAVKKLLAEHGIEHTDESVVAFIESIGGDEIGILCYQVGPDANEFKLVSGSPDDIIRMTKTQDTYHGSPHWNAHVSFE